MLYSQLPAINIIGHRGSSEPFPENTLEAILHGILSGANMLEIDLCLSKDKEVILSHDQNLKKIAGINLYVHETNWKELSKILIKKKKKTFHLTRLKDVVKAVPRDIQFYLELKSSISVNWNRKLSEAVISIIKKEKMTKRCLLMSFDQSLVEYVKKKYPSCSAGIIVKSAATLNTVLNDAKIHFDCIAMNYKLLTKRRIQIIQNREIPFIAWTVNSIGLWRKIASYQPSGIVTDFPEKFSSL